MKGLLAAAFAETAVISYRDLKSEKMPPPPADFVAVAVIYGGLALLPDSASTVAGMFGWGLVLATLLNLWNPTNPTGGLGPATYQKAPTPTPTVTAGTGPATPGNVVFAPRSKY